MHPRLFPEPAARASESGHPWITAFCDGGSRGNPGPAGYGVLVQGPDGATLAELSDYLGRATNNVAEYRALLAALDFALAHGHPRLRVVADSELLVRQIQGRYKVASPDLRPLYDEAKRRIARLDAFRIEHVLRGKNKKADHLANAAMDRGMGKAPAEPNREISATPYPKAPAATPPMLRGFTRDGVVHVLGDTKLPDGMFVKILPE